LIRSWKSFERPDLMQPFVEHVFSSLKDGGELFKGSRDSRQKAFYDDLDSNLATRRAFLLAASRVGFGQFQTVRLLHARLLKATDFEWLLTISPVGAAPISDIDAETLCNMIQLTFDSNSAGQFEALYLIATQWQPLKRRYIGLLEGVPLDSAEAKQARENQRLMDQLARKKPAAMEPPPAQRVRDRLARFESGQLDAWWHLNFELTLSTHSTHYLVDHDFLITKMPGWLAADEETRNEIISAAECYLRNAEPLGPVFS
jgi:hypothetical protein